MIFGFLFWTQILFISHSNLIPHNAFVPSCHSAIALSCHRAFVPSCLRAFVPSCHRAFVLSCLRAIVPSCYLTIIRIFVLHAMKETFRRGFTIRILTLPYILPRYGYCHLSYPDRSQCYPCYCNRFAHT